MRGHEQEESVTNIGGVVAVVPNLFRELIMINVQVLRAVPRKAELIRAAIAGAARRKQSNMNPNARNAIRSAGPVIRS